jgi:hypothetical protein
MFSLILCREIASTTFTANGRVGLPLKDADVGDDCKLSCGIKGFLKNGDAVVPAPPLCCVGRYRYGFIIASGKKSCSPLTV